MIRRATFLVLALTALFALQFADLPHSHVR